MGLFFLISMSDNLLVYRIICILILYHATLLNLLVQNSVLIFYIEYVYNLQISDHLPFPS